MACAPAARAIVTFAGDADAASQKPPANGAPWRHIARVGAPEGSGVYLGKRFILTANHVSGKGDILLDGKTYQADPAFTMKRLGKDDLKLLRINGDPGLPALLLIGLKESEFAKRCTVIGWGMGRGTYVAPKGWTWNDIRLQRWGTNITSAYQVSTTEGPRLVTGFNRGAGGTEMSVANSDSGCGLFIQVSGIWKLAGIAVDVDDNGAFFDRSPSVAGFQPTRSYYARIRPYRTVIDGILAAAAP